MYFVFFIGKILFLFIYVCVCVCVLPLAANKRCHSDFNVEVALTTILSNSTCEINNTLPSFIGCAKI
jgi:hypothetical protein